MCTGIRINAKDGSIIYARTMEFGVDIESDVIVVPRKYKLTGKTPDKTQMGLSWETKYACVGPNAKKTLVLADGLNEKGLAVAAFYFPGYSELQEVSEEDCKHTIAAEEFRIWALSQFATVSEVKAELPNVKVGKVEFEAFENEKFVLPLHYVIYDSAGNSIVVQYVKCQVNVRENTLGLMGNYPTFDWHMTNLRNYVNLSPLNVPPVELSEIKLEQLGEGSGLLGLPGDFTPPSRFVRSAVFSKTTQAALPAKTGEEAVLQAFHILNNFDIPKGSVRPYRNSTNPAHYDYTEWTSACDLQSKRFYSHTYESRIIRMMYLMNCDLDAQNIVRIEISESEQIHDLTNQATTWEEAPAC